MILCFRFGVVCAFVSNEQIQEGVHQLPRNLRVAVSDSNKYVGVTKRQIGNLLGEKYQKFRVSLDNILDGENIFVLK